MVALTVPVAYPIFTYSGKDPQVLKFQRDVERLRDVTAEVLNDHAVLIDASGGMSAGDILAALLTVDGAGSGLDADLLDGTSSAGFAAASHSHAIANVTRAVPWQFPDVVVTSGDQTLIGTAATDITGLTFAVVAGGTYYYKFVVQADADANTTGISLMVNGPASPTRISNIQGRWNGSAGSYVGGNAYDSPSAAGDSGGTNIRIHINEGILVNGANAGSLTARILREAVGSGPNVRAGSCGFLWRLA